MSGTSDEREAFMRGYLAAYEQYQEVCISTTKNYLEIIAKEAIDLLIF